MLTRRAVAAILIAGATQFATTQALACRCAGPLTSQGALDRADAVVVAEVISVEGNFEAEGGAIATLKTSKAWKAGVPATLRVETRTTCAFDFRTGETYLVYLTRPGYRAAYATTICNGNRRVGEAGPALDWLGKNASPRSVGQ